MAAKNLLLSLLILLSTQVFAEEREWAPYRKLMETTRMDKFAATALAERGRVILSPTVTPESKRILPQDVVITVVHGAERQAFRVGADHKLAIPFKQKWFDDNAQMTINVPKGERMNISFSLDALVPDGAQWPYANLMGSVAQANALIKSQAGMLSLFAPKVKSVVLRFAQPAQVKIAAKDGVRVLATDAKNAIWMKPDEALMRENPVMTLSERPRAADLESD
jgi:hypothetical protein